MRREPPVRIREGLGVKLPRATRLVMGFQYAHDARAMMEALRDRVGEFHLTLHEEKTRLIEFGRLPSLAKERSGQQRCATFAFLGFTHYCGRTRDGRFVVKRQTQSKRLTRKLQELRHEARQRRHTPIADQHTWLSQVLRGHYAYLGLPSNFRMLNAFHRQVRDLWHRALRRRSQRGLSWDQFAGLLERFPLPRPRITHPALPRPI